MNSMVVSLTLSILLSICFSSEAWLCPNRLSMERKAITMTLGAELKRSAVATALISSLGLLAFNPPTYAANDALIAAQRAMMTESEKKTDNRSFKELPLAAQKRRAMDMCKEKKTLRAAGYKDEKTCKSDALAGNFGMIVQAATGDGSYRGTATSAKDVMKSQ